jgi:hypothetical protein
MLTNPGITFVNAKIMSAIFTAVFLAILNNKVPGELQNHVVPAALSAGLPSSSIPDLFAAITNGTTAAIQAVPGINAQIIVDVANATTDAYAAAYAFVYYTAMAVGLFGLILSCFMRDMDVYLTGHIPKQIYKNEETNVDVLTTKEVSDAHHEVA